jgi:hypothetical protein
MPNDRTTIDLSANPEGLWMQTLGRIERYKPVVAGLAMRINIFDITSD